MSNTLRDARWSISDRDQERCVVCHIHQPQSQYRCMDKHHIDGDRENNMLSNLVTLCPWHHKRMHTLRRSFLLAWFVESIRLSAIAHWRNEHPY